MEQKTLTEQEAINLAQELQEEIMPKIKLICARLHSGSDAMRDEGDKLGLIYHHLKTILER